MTASDRFFAAAPCSNQGFDGAVYDTAFTTGAKCIAFPSISSNHGERAKKKRPQCRTDLSHELHPQKKIKKEITKLKCERGGGKKEREKDEKLGLTQK